MRILRVALFCALATHAAAAADGIRDSIVTDLRALNACIETAIDERESWPRSPGEVLNHLFSLTPDCVLPTNGTMESAASTSDSSAVLVFRHSLPHRPQEGQWLHARLSCEPDGTWRMRQLVSFAEVQERSAATHGEGDGIHGIQWSSFNTSQGPIALLDFLKQRRNSWMAPIFPRGWIKESDLPTLMGLVESTEPCANVMNMVSSVVDTTTSTIGNEAAYLIEGFRTGGYPPRLVSTLPRCDVREIKAWWSKRQGP